MTGEPRNTEAQVLKRLLLETDQLSGNSPHLDDETLALFAAGALGAADRHAAIEHLALCDHCRRVAALQLDEVAEPAVALAPRRTAWLSPRVQSWALAAAIFAIASSYFVFGPLFRAGPGGNDPNQVAKNDPPAKPDLVGPKTGSESSKNPSPRPPLESIALASQGRLTDYGFGLDGRRSADYTTIKSLEALPAGQDLPAILARGQVFLHLGEGQQASAVFQTATANFPQEPLSWLGAGLAAFLDKKPADAEKDFRHALKLDPQNQSARINLAISLEAQNNPVSALQIWKELLRQQLPPADQEKIEHHVQVLETRPKREP